MGDWVGVIESGYRLDDDVDGWLRSVLAAVRPLIDGGSGVAGWTYTLSASEFRLDQLEVEGQEPKLGTLARAVLDGLAPVQLQRLHATRPPEGGTLSGKIFGDYPGSDALLRRLTGGAVADVVGVLAPTATGRGLMLVAPLREARRPSAREKVLFARVAAHLGAGLRLRLALEGAAPDATAEEAVLDGGGRLLHAESGARRRDAGELLREAVLRRERARTRKGRSDPDSALALWQGLVAGRWSLVDRFERDGKRFVVARRNAPDVGDPRGLTRREHQVAEHLGLGWSEKEIAYTLGIGQSGVSNCVRRAVAKLGVSGRAELASFFSPLGVRARLRELELAGETLAVAGVPLLSSAAAEALSVSELDVALELLRGATVEAIAERRGRSAETVATQVKAIYEKLNVGSRVELAARASAA